MRDNGAIEGASDGFAEDDEVILMVDMRETDEKIHKVIAHKDGVKPCSLYVVEFLHHVIGGSLYWKASGDICDKLLDEEEIAAADEMSYHLYAGEWIHDGNHINWKAVIETGETDPETGEPITRPITDKDKRPETAMEWVSGSSYGTPPPDGSVMPQYKRSLLDAWDIWADWDASTRNNWGTSQESMEDANRAEADGRITTFSNGAVGSTYTEWAYLKGTNAGGDIEWPPFVSGDNAYTTTYTSDYSWEGDPGGGCMSDEGTSNQTINYNYCYNFIACGDGKAFGVTNNQRQTSSEAHSLYIDTAERHVINSQTSTTSETTSVSALTYGDRIIRPATTYYYHHTYNASLNAIGSVGVPANGSYGISESGVNYAPYVAIGCGDDEFVCLYQMTEYDNNRGGSFTSADLSWSTWAPYAEWPWRNSIPLYHATGVYETHEIETYWVAFRTKAGAEYLKDVAGDSFMIKDGITHIRVAKSDLNNSNYEYAWMTGCDCGDYFFINITRYQSNPYPAITDWMNYTQFLSINKKTGVHYLTDVEAARTSELKGLSIYVKGIGKDVYKEPEPEPEPTP